MTMNLSGSLEAFGLGDVLTLLGMGGRTARMQVTSPAGVGSVHLVDGHVSAASADLTRAGLLRQLVAAAVVPATDLAHALEAADPVVALVESGVVGRDVAHRVAVEHVVDALGEMLGWTDGEFAVWSGEADPADIGVRLPIGEALDRGRSREQEWARVRESLPEGDSVLALVPDVPEGVSLGVEDWSVLARVDGRRTLAEVLGAAGVAPLAASDRLVQLMGRGLVRVRPDDVVAPDQVAELIAAFESGPPPAGAEAEVPVVVSELLVDDEAPAAAVPAGAAAEEVLVAADPVPVPVLAEPLEVAPQPWDLPRATVEEPDPAVSAWLESAAPPDELVALLGQLPVGVEGAGDEAGEDPMVGSLEAVPVEPATAQEAADEVPALEPAAEPVFSFPVQVEAPTWAPVHPEPAPPAAVEAPVAPGVEWSPWAQALGLGAPAPEGELVVDPLAGPGIAKMIADAHGLAETSVVPVPQVPVPPTGAVVDGAGTPDPGDITAQAEEQAFVPVPREPELPAADEAPVDVAPAATPADPLSGGLLSQLMTGVRGL